mmetsp:Transcript_363/g.671  ORF Transcript_363/g.671 Transcript_363/m.671 type:complete len:209 (+) Transcript_363:810-1436(+)
MIDSKRKENKHTPIEPMDQNAKEVSTYNYSDFKKTLEAFLNHSLVQAFMTIITIYALMGDDLRLLLFPKSTDNTFTGLTSLSLVMFLFELILSSLAKQDYFNSFFFWLDLFSTISLVTDIQPAMDLIFGSNDEASEQSDAVSLARASRGARIGTKAGRMTRVIRLIRLIRIVKLYKSANQAMVNEEEKQKMNKNDIDSMASMNMEKNT